MKADTEYRDIIVFLTNQMSLQAPVAYLMSNRCFFRLFTKKLTENVTGRIDCAGVLDGIRFSLACLG